ncbi:MAG: hypothetical protein HC780_20950 [Leptolyngbyaceae cyanobacterium CSU_1_3]|nr:hypothetical protein [Leptolyngbyaceae cyanobacterium CSU_1_3]
MRNACLEALDRILTRINIEKVRFLMQKKRSPLSAFIIKTQTSGEEFAKPQANQREEPSLMAVLRAF